MRLTIHHYRRQRVKITFLLPRCIPHPENNRSPRTASCYFPCRTGSTSPCTPPGDRSRRARPHPPSLILDMLSSSRSPRHRVSAFPALPQCHHQKNVLLSLLMLVAAKYRGETTIIYPGRFVKHAAQPSGTWPLSRVHFTGEVSRRRLHLIGRCHAGSYAV